MNAAEIRANLQAAYKLIKQGDRQQAVALLNRIIKAKPDEADAWWLLANALEDEAQRRVALHRTVTFNPDHVQARAALDKLKMTTQTVQPMPKERSGRLMGVLLGVVVLAGVIGVGLAVMMSGQDEAPTETVAAVVLPSDTATATETTAPTATLGGFIDRSPVTLLPTHTVLATISQRATLPPAISPVATMLPTYPTWTPRPTLYIEPSPTHYSIALNPTTQSSGATRQPGGTSRQRSTDTPVPTLAIPSAVGEDYWYGFDGSMNEYSYDGGYFRFYEFPVKFWHAPPPNQSWQVYINDAIAQIGQVVPIQWVGSQDEADLILVFLSRDDLYESCESSEVVGCGGMRWDLNRYRSTRAVYYWGYARVASDTDYLRGVILHELLHAVGVLVHSNNPVDVMYWRINQFEVPYMSERDYNTLRRLYSAVVFDDW